MPNYYRMLGVDPLASAEAITQAYRAKRKKLEGGPEAQPDLKGLGRLAAAYAVLSDPERRKAYDEERQRRLAEDEGCPTCGSELLPDGDCPTCDAITDDDLAPGGLERAKAGLQAALSKPRPVIWSTLAIATLATMAFAWSQGRVDTAASGTDQHLLADVPAEPSDATGKSLWERLFGDDEAKHAEAKRGIERLRRHQAAAAVPDLQAAVDSDPERDDWRLALAAALVEAGKPDEAAEHLRQLPDQATADAKSQAALGYQKQVLGDAEGAMAAYRKALRHNPKQAEALINLGALLVQAGDKRQAAATLNNAVELLPRNPKARYVLGLALMLAGQERKASQVLKQSAELFTAQGRQDLAETAQTAAIAAFFGNPPDGSQMPPELPQAALALQPGNASAADTSTQQAQGGPPARPRPANGQALQGGPPANARPQGDTPAQGGAPAQGRPQANGPSQGGAPGMPQSEGHPQGGPPAQARAQGGDPSQGGPPANECSQGPAQAPPGQGAVGQSGGGHAQSATPGDSQPAGISPPTQADPQADETGTTTGFAGSGGHGSAAESPSDPTTTDTPSGNRPEKPAERQAATAAVDETAGAGSESSPSGKPDPQHPADDEDPAAGNSPQPRQPTNRRAWWPWLALPLALLGAPTVARLLRRKPPPEDPGYERVATAMGQLAHQRLGDGVPVVLLHRLAPGASQVLWESSLADLAEAYRVHTLDLPGFGHSDKPFTRYSAQKMATALNDYLAEAVGEPALIVADGLSAGIAARTAANAPGLVAGLILLNPASTVDQALGSSAWRWLAGIPGVGTPMMLATCRRQAIADGLGDGAPTELVDECHAFANQPRAGRALSDLFLGAMNVDLPAVLDQVSNPVTVVWSQNRHPERANALRQRLKQLPGVRVATLKTAQLMPQLEDPTRLRKLVQRVLASRQEAAAGSEGMPPRA